MRRFLSILVIAQFCLAPLAPIVPATAQAQLPPCCRRHGPHHCAMAAMMAQMQQSAPSSPIFTAPDHCPLYHAYSPATAPSFAPPPSGAAASAPVARLVVASPRAGVRFPIRARAVRGPPVFA